MKNKRYYQLGLSIAEMSIVLVIVGILLAAITAGSNLQKAAQIKGIMSEVSSYQIMIETFDSKYDDLPGDMGDAHNYWGAGGSTICGNATQCNGDIDGQIELSADGDDNESYRAWQHLSLSGILDISYRGTAITSDDQADIAINVPASKRDKSGYMLIWDNTGGFNRNEIQLGAFRPNEANTNSSLTPHEAFSIDNKIDDGDPDSGIVFGQDASDASANSCVTAGGAYNTTGTDEPSCIMAFPIMQ